MQDLRPISDTGDDRPFEIIPGHSGSGLVLLADHATSIVPEPYGLLGLPASAFNRHIAYDIGIESLTRELAERLGCPAVLSRFSRLLIDPNRGEDDPTLIMKISDGTIVPSNHPISDEELENRIRRFHRPYHQAVASVIEKATDQTGRVPLVLSLHSFTPVWKGFARPWHAAVLWDSDGRAARPLIDLLRTGGDLVVGDNEPYDGALKGDTLYRHCMRKGIPHALLEIRQDLIGNAEGVAEWAERIEPIFRTLDADAALHETYVDTPSVKPFF